MKSPDEEPLWSKRSLRYLALIFASWTALVAVLLVRDLHLIRVRTVELAKNAARIIFEKDLLMWRWVADRGGVYVPVTEAAPPNPYLSMVPERDIVTPSGRRLTLFDSSYVIRQIHEMTAEETGIGGNITSLRPLRPENAPDAWEAAALRRLENGSSEVIELQGSGDGAAMRFIRLLRTERSCLPCHEQTGNRLGDIRGGISVSVPMAPYEAAVRRILLTHAGPFVLIWLLGVGAIAWGGRRVRLQFRDQRRIERIMREKEAFLDESQRVASLGSYDLDVTSGRWSGSRTLDDVFGIAPDHPKDLEGWLVIVHPDDREEMRRYFEEHVIAGRNPFEKEYRIVRQNDGEERWVYGRGELKFDEEGVPVRMIGTIQDVTERRHLEEMLRQGQKMEAVGLLAGGVAHDFNNMLQAINGYIDLAARELPPERPERNHLEVAARAGERAAKLVRQLLAFGRRQVLRPEELDLNEVVAAILKMIERTLGEHIRIDFLPGFRIGTVFADRVQMEQVLLNLCINARDSMPDGGTITIETENVLIDTGYCRDHPWARLGRYVLLSVTDTGFGMDAQTLGRIWEPFFTTKKAGEGTGLGLSTVQGIVSQHDGMIHAYSEPGKGTTFKIYLPIVERPAAEVGTKVNGPAVGGAETVLVAEDEESVRALTCELLREAGYTVLEAKDGEEALRIFEEREGAVDAAILDVMMPRLGGRVVHERMKSRNPAVRILFTSGYSPNAVHTNFVLEEGLELLQKPFDAKHLLRMVRRVLDQE